MTGKKKTPKVAGFMRAVFADNVQKLMLHHYRDSANRPKALAMAAGVSLSTVQRILAGASGATLDNVESVAGAFHLSAYQIMVPSLDPDNPPVIKGATQEEQKLYRSWKRARLTEAEIPASTST